MPAWVPKKDLAASGKVTVKQAATSEKLESPKARPQGEVINISLLQKDMKAGSLSFLQQSKTGSVSGPPPEETAPVATIEFRRVKMVNESCKVAPSHNVTEDKPAFEWYLRRSTSVKGKKKIKEILQKADAQGTTSDLYNAYKGPEEQKNLAMPWESSNVSNDVSNQKQAPATPQAVSEATVDAEPAKNEPENWEDAADVSTPKLESGHAKPGSSDEVRDSGSNIEKKYSRHFLLKFADQFTALPPGLDVSPDFENTLFYNNMGAYHHGHDSYPTPGKAMDRRPSNQGSLTAGYEGNVGFRYGKGGNSGVLRNPPIQQGPIMSRPMQHVGPMGGMGRHTPMQMMHKAERNYLVGTVAEEDSRVFLKETSTINESLMDVNGFHVLPSQVESVMRLFERHPDIAVGFRAKNQGLRNSCMNSLLSLIETLCQPLEDISNEDLVGADIALTYVKDSGFRVDWLEKMLDKVKEKKEKELSGLAILQETEESLLKLKQKCAELNALAEKKKTELSAIRTPLSFDDV